MYTLDRSRALACAVVSSKGRGTGTGSIESIRNRLVIKL